MEMDDIFSGVDLSVHKPQVATAKMISLHVKSGIQYRYAKTVVTSTVLNTADKADEIFFHIILPESAFISEFEMKIEGKSYKAHIKEKEEAKIEYNEAVSLGRTAGHVAHTVRDSNKFTVSVNVESNKEVIFKLTYEELLKRELSAYKHCINIDPGQLVQDLKVEVSILESCAISILEVPPVRESNELEPESNTAADPFVKIKRPGPNKANIRWAPTVKEQEQLNKKGVKGQLIVRYDVDRLSKPEEVLINNGYFVHFFAPSDVKPLRKHVIFVLDISGSMSGRKMDQLIAAMNTILSDIGTDDFFSLVIFSTAIFVWDSNGPNQLPDSWQAWDHGQDQQQEENLANTVVVPATLDNIQKAKDFINSLTAYSSTYIYEALIKAIDVVRLGKTLNASAKQLPEPMIIFLTDGQANGRINDTEEIVREITSKNAETNAAIFTLGFGGDADMNFLKKLSLRNSGFGRKIYEASDAALQLKNFYLQVASPLLSNVKFNYQDDKVDTSSVTRTSLPTLFQGSEFVIVGRLLGNSIGGELMSRSRDGNCTRPIVKPIVLIDKTSFMERMWAYLTIQQLLDSVTATSGGDQSNENKKKALELALKYSFVTTLTSLVVVKPDNKTTSTDTERADEPVNHGVFGGSGGQLFGGRSVARHAAYSPLSLQYCAPASSFLFGSTQSFGFGSAPASQVPPSFGLFGSSAAAGSRRPLRGGSYAGIAQQCANIKAVVFLGDDLLLDDESSLDDDDVAVASKANGIVLSSLDLMTNIKYQHAATTITVIATNPTSNLLQGEFQLTLPYNAVISSCILEAANQTVIAEAILKTETVTKLACHTDNAVLVSKLENQDGMRLTLRLQKNENVTVKIVYEESLFCSLGRHYEFVLYTNIHHILERISSTTIIDESCKIVNVKAFFHDDTGILLPIVECPSSNKAIITWTADKEKQKELKQSKSSGKFTIEYGIDTSSVPEYIVTPGGYPIHRSGNPQVKDAHWIIVVDPVFKNVALVLLDKLFIGTFTIIIPQRENVVFTAYNTSAVIKFVTDLPTLDAIEECDIEGALLEALKISSATGPSKLAVMVTLVGEKVDPGLVNQVTSRNREKSAAIFCLVFNKMKNIEHTKKLAFSNSGFARILYPECTLSNQVLDFHDQIQTYILNPAPFKYIEDQLDLDHFWRKSYIASEMSEVKETQLSLEASIVCPGVSLLALQNRNA